MIAEDTVGKTNASRNTLDQINPPAKLLFNVIP